MTSVHPMNTTMEHRTRIVLHKCNSCEEFASDCRTLPLPNSVCHFLPTRPPRKQQQLIPVAKEKQTVG
jgi:hypothetical protein